MKITTSMRQLLEYEQCFSVFDLRCFMYVYTLRKVLWATGILYGNIRFSGYRQTQNLLIDQYEITLNYIITFPRSPVVIKMVDRGGSTQT